MDYQPTDNKKKVLAALGVLAAIVLLVTLATLNNKDKVAATSTQAAPQSSNAQTPTTNTVTNTTPTTTPVTTQTSAYKDGSYTATGSYDSPGGNEDITVTLTLQGDVITGTSAKSGAGDPEASEYQQMFISGYKSLIVGKKINTVKLSRVSGSSLTSQGFNDALAQIKSQAQS